MLAILLVVIIIVGVTLLARFSAVGTRPVTAQPRQAAMFGVDAQHTHANPAEHVLTPRTVARLAVDWASMPTGGSLFSSPISANGVIYINSLDGRLYAYNAAGCGRSSCAPLWFSARTGNLIYSSPAVANGTVYISAYNNKLYAFNAGGCGRSPCEPVWTSTAVQGVTISSPTVSNGVVFVGTSGGFLYAFNAGGCGRPTCGPLWTSTPMRAACEPQHCL